MTEWVDTPEMMIDLGKRVAAELSDGNVLALTGGLGAGKTHFTKGLALGLGCHQSVTSPTFTLAHEYTGGRLPIFHFDFYRMESVEEVLRIGWDEYLDSEGVVVIEWPNKFPDLIPQGSICLEFEIDGERRRVLRRA
ncbi:tRNA (adenosine(37)-N6)-threonylcarbamoyltransferase complex ATPase subunit type 1 TsaE [Verrucomicrobiaceae bacterium N1E253]|uniref:tRNA threonylcarbamoyladenosine biosynthesis protein TsaE n=1 Tax=Oceaniferula marina TaxID=2748318 RepID=A0A851GNK6_9BACT|nr:tRNA (adenosine(37)-N6)-threonylcarbamoyltransferase complex ATPase subunit type 1 TsaE [Oceaniferula marina]NWK56617.1 tRNA (adenosine(37)-N6)-threonylcarbamoyltransferase complex ATPase subunit type 1 TsaE [Oceaniferula marina]